MDDRDRDQDRDHDLASTRPAPSLGWALAGLSAGAAAIHFAMTPIHASSGWQEPLGFALTGWFQLIVAGMALTGWAGRRLYQVAVLANVGFIAIWAWSRTAGLPFGDDPGVAEPIGAIDAVCVGLEVGIVLVGLRLLLAGQERSTPRLAPALCAVGALGLATVVITSPDAADHAHSEQLSELDEEVARIARDRCDTDVNVAAYWDEAAYLGIDTDFGGIAPAVEGAASSDDGHHGTSSASGTTTTTEPDPNGGRGSDGLDSLVSKTALAAVSEGAAASLVTALSDADDEDYAAWLWWLRGSGSLQHEHSAAVSDEDGSGHGGHVGPQLWVAMTDQRQCDQLDEEIALARDTAMSYPTVADAEAAGYSLTTGYVPGIAAHYIDYSLIDGTFEVDRPEMILYDGTDPDSHVVGLSYYLLHPGDNKPTQGFTGDNDHAHRHIGLCSAGGKIIGDSTTTPAECEARGGSTSDGSSGWMSHAWVVPGCESPWGVFSAASPVLDGALGAASPDGGPGCASSAVRDRYRLDGGAASSRAAASTDAGEPDEGAAGN